MRQRFVVRDDREQQGGKGRGETGSEWGDLRRTSELHVQGNKARVR